MRRPSISVSVCLPSRPRSASVLRPPTWRGESVRPGAPRTASSRSEALRASSSSRPITVTLAGAVRASCSARVAVTVTAGSAVAESCASSSGAVADWARACAPASSNSAARATGRRARALRERERETSRTMVKNS